MRSVFAVVRRLLSSNKVSYIITAAVVVCATSKGNVVLSNGNYTWLLALLSPFFFVFYDFMKLMHLGASKKDYYLASLISYAVLAFLISLVNTVIHLVIDPLYPAQTVINMMDLCGWSENGVAIAFLQQMVFLLLVMVSLHVLLSMQAYWYGWVADAVLVAVISVFTPIARLRGLLSLFFHFIMINGNAWLHIPVSLILTALLSFAGLLVLKRKTL